MKLIINYDLMNEITCAKTGFNVQRFANKMEIYFRTTTALTLLTLFQVRDLPYGSMISSAIYATSLFGCSELALKSFTKEKAEARLRNLASSHTKINIYTDSDSIKKAYLYKTQYKIVREEKATLQQNKYIMLPTTGTFNADEVSLLQEHNIGSREYVLSIGEPKKSHRKVLSHVFSRQM